MGALNVEKTLETALRTALTDNSRAAQELVSAYVNYATGVIVPLYEILWSDDSEWTIDGLAVELWVEFMTNVRY